MKIEIEDWSELIRVLKIVIEKLNALDDKDEKNEGESFEVESSLDWIFENAEYVSNLRWGCSVDALAKCLGIDNLCYSGEGVEHFNNSQEVLALARPFLVIGDKEGWLAYAEKYKNKRDNK